MTTKKQLIDAEINTLKWKDIYFIFLGETVVNLREIRSIYTKEIFNIFHFKTND